MVKQRITKGTILEDFTEKWIIKYVNCKAIVFRPQDKVKLAKNALFKYLYFFNWRNIVNFGQKYISYDALLLYIK